MQITAVGEATCPPHHPASAFCIIDVAKPYIIATTINESPFLQFSFTASNTQSLNPTTNPSRPIDPRPSLATSPHLTAYHGEHLQNNSQTPLSPAPTSPQPASRPSRPRPHHGLAIQRRHKRRPNQQPLPQRPHYNHPRPRCHAQSTPRHLTTSLPLPLPGPTSHITLTSPLP